MQVGTRTFSRIRVVAPGGDVELAVPDDVPVAEVVRQVTGRVGADPSVRWMLRHPVTGPVDREATLAGAGVLDGQSLLLVEDVEGRSPAFVDDVAELLADDGSGRARWGPDTTRLTALAATAAAAAAAVGTALALFPAGRSAAVAAGVACGCLVAGAVLRAVRQPHSRTAAAGPLLLAVTGAVLLVLAAWPATSAALAAGVAPAGTDPVDVGAAVRVTGLAAAVLVAGLALGVAAAAAQGAARAAALGGATLAVAGLVDLLLVGAGLSTPRAAALVVVAALVALTYAPRGVAEASGLGPLADLARRGSPPRRSEVLAAVGRARAGLTAVLAGTGCAIALAARPLWAHGGTVGRALAAVALVVLLLRGRAYRAPARVLALAGPAIGGALLLAALWTVRAVADGAAAGRFAGAVVLAVLAAAALVVPMPGEVGRTRLRLQLNRVETLLLIAVPPLVFGVFAAYAWAMDRVR